MYFVGRSSDTFIIMFGTINFFISPHIPIVIVYIWGDQWGQEYAPKGFMDHPKKSSSTYSLGNPQSHGILQDCNINNNICIHCS